MRNDWKGPKNITVGDYVISSAIFDEERTFIKAGNDYWIRAKTGGSVQGLYRTQDFVTFDPVINSPNESVYSIFSDSRGNAYVTYSDMAAWKTRAYRISGDGTKEELGMAPETDEINYMLAFCHAYPVFLE